LIHLVSRFHRLITGLLVVFACLAALAPTLLAPSPAAAATARTATLSSTESRLLTQVNAARAAAGLRAVVADRALVTLARERSTDMARRNYFDHYSPEGRTFLDTLRARHIPFAQAGEIIAKNNYPAAQSEDQAFAAYMGSAEHHAIILMPNWKTAGLGMAVDAHGMYYYTVLFAQPTNSPTHRLRIVQSRA
jgi:uncharacterized protein YkwD